MWLLGPCAAGIPALPLLLPELDGGRFDVDESDVREKTKEVTESQGEHGFEPEVQEDSLEPGRPLIFHMGSSCWCSRWDEGRVRGKAVM